MLPVAMAWSSSSRMTKSQEEGAILGFSSPLTMHCNVFAANDVMQQQNRPFCHCLGVMGVHIVANRRDHSVAATFAANGIGREGMMGVHNAGKV